MRKRKRNFTTLILIVILLAGLSLLLYPTVSDHWNSLTQSKAIAGYAEEVADLDEDKYQQMWLDAQAYNAGLLERSNQYVLSEEQAAEYGKLLNISGNGIMGYVEIPIIGCALPIYHGTDDAALQIAVGHLEWTSLPSGGEGTHSVLSGHRGLPSAKLFSDLDKLSVGDTFVLRVLDEVLTYEVDQILIVEPHETEELQIIEGADYCTLVTCTPYGVNSHRLLVRGHRIENLPEEKIVRVTANALQIEPMIVAPIVAMPMLLVLLILLMLPQKHKKTIGDDYDEDF